MEIMMTIVLNVKCRWKIQWQWCQIIWLKCKLDGNFHNNGVKCKLDGTYDDNGVKCKLDGNYDDNGVKCKLDGNFDDYGG